MSKRTELALRIKTFLDSHAELNADYDSEYDDEHDQFASPDASSVYAAYTYLVDDKIPPKTFRIDSSWESGGYKPYSDHEARMIHDELIGSCKKLTVEAKNHD
jgi:hypothetical protein